MAIGSRGLKGVAVFLSVCAFLANIAYGQSTIPLVGSVSTASPAETIGINGNTVYTCDDNEISIIDVTQPSKPALLGTLGSPTSTANTFCDVQRGDLVQMLNTSTPAFRVYDLSNQASPNLTASTAVNKQFFGAPYFQGNTAFFGTNVIVFGEDIPGRSPTRREISSPWTSRISALPPCWALWRRRLTVRSKAARSMCTARFLITTNWRMSLRQVPWAPPHKMEPGNCGWWTHPIQRR